jgi:HEAT repeat protein
MKNYISKSIAISSILFGTQAIAGEWEEQQLELALQMHISAPTLSQQVAELTPMVNRADAPVFRGAIAENSDAAPLFLERFTNGDESTEIRVALAWVLMDFQTLPFEFVQDEEDEAVRGALLEQYKTAPAEVAIPALEAMLSDGSSHVRSQAARLAGYHNTPELDEPLIQALSDSNPGVRALAARSLGWHNSAQAYTSITRLLDDSVPEVRLRALRALDIIDATRTAALPQLQSLALDRDITVARKANQILAR